MNFSSEQSLADIGRALTGVSFVISVFICIMIFMLGRVIIKALKKERLFVMSAKSSLLFGIAAVMCGLLLYFLHIFFQWLRTEVVDLQSIGFQISCVYWLLSGLVGLWFLYFSFTLFYRQEKQIQFLPLVINGAISGLSNTFVIYIINQSLNVQGNFTNGLFYAFLVGLVVHIMAERYIRTKIAVLTNQVIYEKRVALIDKTLHIPFERMERFEKGKISACLNNDTEKISEGMHLAVTGATNLITLFFCLIYLGILSFWGLILSLAVVVITILINLIVAGEANRLFEQTRDIQNKFFGFINDMLAGFKELALNRARRKAFQENFEGACEDYRRKGTKADLKFANAFIMEDIILLSVVGFVAFLFPVIFHMQGDLLYNYVFIFLYMIGPVTYLLHSFPQIMQIHVSWKRMTSLMSEVSELEKDDETDVEVSGKEVTLTLKGVQFEYKGLTENFSVGPIDYEFKPGELTFITGGNGSGKSTFAKLITGLYPADRGEMLINGIPKTPEQIKEYYSAIFSDFYLFDRLYGIEIGGREKEINNLLELLRIQDKVSIKDGEFSTTKLSTGQKKRLALLVAYLEDRPICLFDEWAADQDPGYRKFFYHHLLPQLRDKGKCVIAITHDDHYFHTADHLVKMDQGQFVEN
ncbi:cyclic peptide export ABC transporter [Bacillus sp. CLL-7-23]|uniref:Cyclic peptide export ABC transporter n=1 Tax=Bacillus changyiensis TaxID=3004103 RepID=A0ABT4X2S6_9BACI|nr:cyclic peptide export ABC transporter [Bacillus changyiensis]MDA7026598.1 cyclic peptide export ABC transporter [Bacillus changyiensis]